MKLITDDIAVGLDIHEMPRSFLNDCYSYVHYKLFHNLLATIKDSVNLIVNNFPR